MPPSCNKYTTSFPLTALKDSEFQRKQWFQWNHCLLTEIQWHLKHHCKSYGITGILNQTPVVIDKPNTVQTKCTVTLSGRFRSPIQETERLRKPQRLSYFTQWGAQKPQIDEKLCLTIRTMNNSTGQFVLVRSVSFVVFCLKLFFSEISTYRSPPGKSFSKD